MSENKFRPIGITLALIIAVVFFAIAFTTIPPSLGQLFGEIKEAKDKLTFAQLIVSFFGFVGAISAFTFAIIQYRRSEKWKRMEFIANEVKEFEGDPTIRNALQMIDWGARKINLYLVSEPKEPDYRLITRKVQYRALLPHPVKHAHREYQQDWPDSVAVPGEKSNGSVKIEEGKGKTEEWNFTEDEVVIRDTYDVFLTRLDRLSNFIDAKLINARELRPYILYWIEAITSVTESQKDTAWRLALLSYINFYDYSGVITLFRIYKKDITPKGEIFQKLIAALKDKTLADRLYKSALEKD